MTQSYTIRFYEELNEYLSKTWFKKTITLDYKGQRSVKDLIESFNIPHTEVDLILINGSSVTFDHIVKPGDHISVYPVFERFNIQGLIKLRPEPLRETKFAMDTTLIRLGKKLRLLGFDTAMRHGTKDETFIQLANMEKRIILTQSPNLLKRKTVIRGLLVKDTETQQQCRTLMARLDLWSDIDPFSRCLKCNHLLEVLKTLQEASSSLQNQVPEGIKAWCKSYYQCPKCLKIYWKGHHYEAMAAWIDIVIQPPHTI